MAAEAPTRPNAIYVPLEERIQLQLKLGKFDKTTCLIEKNTGLTSAFEHTQEMADLINLRLAINNLEQSPLAQASFENIGTRPGNIKGLTAQIHQVLALYL